MIRQEKIKYSDINILSFTKFYKNNFSKMRNLNYNVLRRFSPRRRTRLRSFNYGNLIRYSSFFKKNKSILFFNKYSFFRKVRVRKIKKKRSTYKVFKAKRSRRFKKYRLKFNRLIRIRGVYKRGFFKKFRTKWILKRLLIKRTKQYAFINNHIYHPNVLISYLSTRNTTYINSFCELSTYKIYNILLYNFPTKTLGSIYSFFNARFKSNFNVSRPVKMRRYMFRKAHIFNKHRLSFILHKNGLKFPSKFKFIFKAGKGFVLKKIFYSFLKPNEYKKFILNSRRKLIYNNIVKKIKKNKTLFKRLFRKDINILNFLKSKATSKSRDLNLITINKWRLGNIRSSFSIKAFSNENEVRIPRVRFKPGYQRLWRNFRLAFAELIEFRYVYQQQLTRHLTKFYRKLNQAYLSIHENSVTKTLIYSRLVPDVYTFDAFYNNGMIFFNNKVLSTKTLSVYKNDFIQLEVSNWYYIFSRWLISSVLKRNLKFKSLVYRKSLAGKYKVMKQVKQRSNYTPKWISTVRYDFSDIKPFLEVDFFTLSMFCIYDPNNILYSTPKDLKMVRYVILRLYNWKYIN